MDDLLGALRPADQVVVWKLDRLGRSLHHLIELVAADEAIGPSRGRTECWSK